MDQWEQWWQVHEDRYLELRRRLRKADARIASPVASKGSDHPVTDPGIAIDNDSHRDLLGLLVGRLQDRDPQVRATCALALGRSGALRTLPHLVVLQGDRARRVRRDATLGAGLLGEPLAVDHLRRVMFDPREAEAQRAAGALALGLLGGREAARSLEEFLDPESDAKVRGGLRRSATLEETAVVALGFSGDIGAAPRLRALLASGRQEDRTRALAATALGRLGDRKAIPLLRKALRDDTEVLRASAAVALGLLVGPDDRADLERLARVARDDRDAGTRRFAQLSLGRVGSERALVPLRSLLLRGRRTDLPFTALALGIARDRKSAPVLRAMFRRWSDPDRRGAVAIALGLLNDRESAPTLVKVAQSKAPVGLRGHCFTALGMMEYRPAAEAARKVLSTERDASVVLPAATLLGLIGDRGVFTLLGDVARRGCCDHHRRSAYRLLGLSGDAKATGELAALVRDSGEKGTLRAGAVTALGELLDSRDTPRLAELGMDSNFPLFRGTLRAVTTGR